MVWLIDLKEIGHTINSPSFFL